VITKQSPKVNSHQITYLTLFLTVICDIMGMGLVFPVLPGLFTAETSPFQLSGDQYHTVYYIAMLIVPFGWTVGGVFIGYLSDIFGRKRILSISLLAATVSYLLCYIAIQAHHLPLFLLARLVIGLGGGCFCLAQTIMIDIAPKELLSKYLGGINVASAIGFVSGGCITYFTSLTHHATLIAPFMVGFWISLLNLLCVMWFIPQTKQSTNPKKAQIKLSIPRATWFYLAMFLQLEFAWGLFLQSTPLILAKYYASSELDISIFFIFNGLSACFTLLVLQPLFEAKFSYERHSIWLSLITATLMLFIYLANSFNEFTILMMLMTFSEFLLFTGILYLLSQKAPEDQRGQVMGMVSSLIGVSFIASDVLMILIPSDLIRLSLLIAVFAYPWFWLEKIYAQPVIKA
jgi:DHA1 family tetracycline resistance protein-like MFS transporter